MNRTLVLAWALLILWIASTQAMPIAAADSTDTTVLSFNIRYGLADDGPDSWPHRRGLVCRTIDAHAPAVFGVQECLTGQAEVLHNAFPEYEFTGMGRDDGDQAGEMCALFTLRERYEVLDRGVFWLSETPEVVGSRSWDAALHRIATWVKLRDRRCRPEVLYVFNTHFDHVGEEARHRSAQLLATRIVDITRGAPVILMGDFNADAEGSPPHDALVGPALRDSWTSATAAERERGTGTFHGFSGQTRRGRIDWILTSPDLPCRDAGIDRTAYAGRYPSDHFPVWAVIRQAVRGR